MVEENRITITLEEYKELLIIKGKYEELKSRQEQNEKATVWREDKGTETLKGKAKPRTL